MNAPISRVLPTPVASAKQSDGNSRSKSVTVGNSLRMTSSACLDVVAFVRRHDLGDAIQDLQRAALRRAQAQAAGDGVDMAVHRLPPCQVKQRRLIGLALGCAAGVGDSGSTSGAARLGRFSTLRL